VKEPVSVDAPAWPPAGSKLTFSLNPQADKSDGRYVFDTNTHQAQKIPGSEGYWKSRWSPDGGYLVSVTSNNKTIGVFEWSSQKWTVIVHGNVLSPVAWSNDSRFVFYQDILDEPIRGFNITTSSSGSSERIVDCRSLLEGGVQRCGFEAVMPDGSVVLRLTRGHDVFSLELHVCLGPGV